MSKVRTFLLELLQLALTLIAIVIVVIEQFVTRLLQASYNRQQSIFDPDNEDE